MGRRNSTRGKIKDPTDFSHLLIDNNQNENINVNDEVNSLVKEEENKEFK